MNLIHSISFTPAWAPIADLDTAATTGVWVDVSRCSDVALLFWKNDAAANVVTLTFNRANTSVGGASEVWDVIPTTAARSTIWRKAGVSDAAISAVAGAAWVRTAPASASTHVTVAASPDFSSIEFNVDDIFTSATTTSGMRWISVNATDPGSAAIGVGIWALMGQRYCNPLVTRP